MTARKRKSPTGVRQAASGTRELVIKGRAGRAAKGKEFSLKSASPAMAAAGPMERAEKNAPRPGRGRYPIPEVTFERLKTRSKNVRTAAGRVVQALDAPKRRDVSRTRGARPAAAIAPAMAPAVSKNFKGITATGWLPPDCTMATGPSHVLLSVNSSLAIYKKTGGAPLMQRTLTQWFSNVAQGLTVFDPKLLYDQHAARWVVLAVAFRQNPNKSVFLLSVSASSDPLGNWRNYTLDAMRDGRTATNNWADFPGLGVDNQALYLTANMFAFGGGFQYAKIRVIPKAGPYGGGAAPFFDFVKMRNADNSLAFTIQPCHTFGAPQVEYLVNSLFPSGSALTLWRITNPVTSPALARVSVPTGPYSLPPNATQKGGGPALNTGDVRIQHAVFRGDSIWTALTTNRNWGAGNRASLHWFQIRAASSALVQQGVYGARDLHYYYPASCPDNNGNLVVVFSSSGPNAFGSIQYTGRRSTDPAGQLQPSTLLKAGVATYQGLDGGGRNRWGDYAGIAADPSQSRVVWFYSEYASALNTWGTWVGSTFF